VAEIQLADVLAGLNRLLILEREIKKKGGPLALLRHALGGGIHARHLPSNICNIFM